MIDVAIAQFASGSDKPYARPRPRDRGRPAERIAEIRTRNPALSLRRFGVVGKAVVSGELVRLTHYCG